MITVNFTVGVSAIKMSYVLRSQHCLLSSTMMTLHTLTTTTTTTTRHTDCLQTFAVIWTSYFEVGIMSQYVRRRWFHRSNHQHPNALSGFQWAPSNFIRAVHFNVHRYFFCADRRCISLSGSMLQHCYLEVDLPTLRNPI
jgi:hypothetical protein